MSDLYVLNEKPGSLLKRKASRSDVLEWLGWEQSIDDWRWAWGQVRDYLDKYDDLEVLNAASMLDHMFRVMGEGDSK